MVNILVETCSITTLLTSVVVLSTEDVFINRVGLLSLIPRFKYSTHTPVTRLRDKGVVYDREVSGSISGSALGFCSSRGLFI